MPVTIRFTSQNLVFVVYINFPIKRQAKIIYLLCLFNELHH